MRRIVVLATDSNPDYFFYVPIVEWVWNKFGWDVALFMTADTGGVTVKNHSTEVHVIPKIDGVRPNTLAQTVRHFASNVLPKDAYIQTQDIDMLPLIPWNPDVEKRTVWGWELTGKSFIPVCYTGMTGDKWYDLMGCTGNLKADMERELKANGRAYGKEWEEYWDTDWDISTKKILAKKDLFEFIPRNLVNLAKDQTAEGRIDRYDISATINQKWIDFHCPNHNPSAPVKWDRVREVLVENFREIPDWLDGYVKGHHNKYGISR